MLDAREAEPRKNVNRSPMADQAVSAIDEYIAAQSIDTSGGSWRTSLPQPQQPEFDADSTYYWDLQTNVGPIVVRLMPEVAPMHVASTIYLTKLGFYDGLSFHRVISQFMAQGGCPLGTGTGGPGYQYAGEFSPSVRHDRPGLLSMANAGPGTDGSQFFLTFVPTPWLDDNHSIFGEVTDGMETVQALEARGSQSGQTTEPLQITSAQIRVE
jgi:cyclophilin family peptidyl-prolyl cis-trans isomerase